MIYYLFSVVHFWVKWSIQVHLFLKQTASNCNLCIEKKYSSGASKKLALGQPDTPVWDPGIRFVLKDVEKIRFQGYTLPKTNMTNETSTI